jgi:hypothetical protein
VPSNLDAYVSQPVATVDFPMPLEFVAAFRAHRISLDGQLWDCSCGAYGRAVFRAVEAEAAAHKARACVATLPASFFARDWTDG